MTAMYVDFRLPERLQARVRPGQSARVQVDALPDRAFPAVVTALDPVIDANGRSLVARGCIDNRLHHLRSGMFAKVMARLGDERVALMVPEEAVVSQGGRQSVIRLLKAQGSDGQPTWTTQRVDVQTGARQDGLVEVVRQLAEGDQVVVAGQQRVQRDGQAVRVTSPTGQNSGEGASGAFRAVPAPGLAGLPLAASAPGQNPCAALIAAPRR
jgi:membrane fusion protein (multidrug efflux system)